MLRLTVLASGSSGNASLVEAAGLGLLLDAGLGPQQLEGRLGRVGRSLGDVHAVLLTHTHTDHWNDRTLALLHQQGVPFYCHPDHRRVLASYGRTITRLEADGLVRFYEEGAPLRLEPGLTCTPFAVPHDAGPTFGFRLEGTGDLFGQGSSVGYACDLGCWDERIAEQLRDVDVLAVEFNHDVEMEASSGRRALLIARVLGDEGHLSNDQAAELVRTVLARSTPGRLRHLVQLHLSRQCNRSALARAAVQPVLSELAPQARLHTAQQDEPTPWLQPGAPAVKRRPRPGARSTRRTDAPLTQGWLFSGEGFGKG